MPAASNLHFLFLAQHVRRTNDYINKKSLVNVPTQRAVTANFCHMSQLAPNETMWVLQWVLSSDNILAWGMQVHCRVVACSVWQVLSHVTPMLHA